MLNQDDSREQTGPLHRQLSQDFSAQFELKIRNTSTVSQLVFLHSPYGDRYSTVL